MARKPAWNTLDAAAVEGARHLAAINRPAEDIERETGLPTAVVTYIIKQAAKHGRRRERRAERARHA